MATAVGVLGLCVFNCFARDLISLFPGAVINPKGFIKRGGGGINSSVSNMPKKRTAAASQTRKNALNRPCLAMRSARAHRRTRVKCKSLYIYLLYEYRI